MFEKYFDGLYPYIFKPKKNRKIINLNIVNIDNFKYFISIKNENNNIHRVIEGIYDTHTFFSSNFSSNFSPNFKESLLILLLSSEKIKPRSLKFSQNIPINIRTINNCEKTKRGSNLQPLKIKIKL